MGVIPVRLFGVDPASVEQALADQARLGEIALQPLRADLEAARRVTAGLVEHRSLLDAEVTRLEAEERALLDRLRQALNRHDDERRGAEEGLAREAAGYEERVRDLTERLRRCRDLEEHLLRSLAGLAGPFVAPASGKEAGHA